MRARGMNDLFQIVERTNAEDRDQDDDMAEDFDFFRVREAMFDMHRT